MTTLMKRNGESNVFSPVPSMFNDPFLRNWFSWSDTENNPEDGTLPAVNIGETDENYELTVAAPGMNKNDFKVELDQNRLIISAEKKEEKESKKGHNFLRKEFNYQSFVRTFTLAEMQVKGDKIQAKYADGILHITIPKSPEAKTKQARVIPIS
jgi:HSP20 family protein